jgi:hypothetical protein
VPTSNTSRSNDPALITGMTVPFHRDQCGEFEVPAILAVPSQQELQIQNRTGTIDLLGSFDFEVLVRVCRDMMRTSKSGH